ncbi:efflux RND transporter periplasmic adaptor subunit [Candidatus Palauibacter sp.]|uniref:efflux RND transporter periplasmic adaptor subunit n=1 Tax=Candidatus Palauibacter sp. TaxID=3101350 RepID=UPI003B5237F9
MLRKLLFGSSVRIIIFILAATGAGVTLLISLAPEAESREPPPRIPFAQTARVTAGSGPIPVYGSGTVRPSAEIDIAPQVGGRVVWVDPGFQSGGRVEAGRTLFRIEEADYLYRRQEAEANLASRRVAFLQEQEQATIAREQYELYAERQSAEGAPSEASPLTLREPQLEAARAALSRDEARLADANLALARTRVTAPFDGVVRSESVDVGQVVSPGQPVGRLFASHAVEVVVPLSDADAALIPGLWELRAGDGEGEVAVRVIAQYGEGSYAWEGYVDRVEASLDAQTRTVDVIVRVSDPFAAGVPAGTFSAVGGSPPLLVGKFVDVEIDGVSPEDYFRVPRAALQTGNEVWAVSEGDVVSIVPVQVLQRANDEVFVTGPLEGGQAVITGGIQFATEGMRVQTGTDPVR